LAEPEMRGDGRVDEGFEDLGDRPADEHLRMDDDIAHDRASWWARPVAVRAQRGEACHGSCPRCRRLRCRASPGGPGPTGSGRMRIFGGALAGLFLFGGIVAAGPAAAGGQDACAALAGMRDARLDLVVTAAGRVPAAAPGSVRAQPYLPPIPVALPAHCKVHGRINDRTGAGGVRYGIGFELALPDDWHGRFLFQGGGGVLAVAGGFAGVSTDSGHRGEGFDASFMQDQRAALDFAHASVGTTTQAALLLVERYYGAAPRHAYIAGCSTGGREAMLATQRWPELFDGALVTAPAMRAGFSYLARSLARAASARAAPRDAGGRPQLARDSGADDKRLVLGGLLAQCDALDGLADGVIEDALGCRFEPARLQCPGDKRADCLDAAQVAALTDAFR